MFCQACGAENEKDARFCNMCGATIAAAGSPGGPTPASPTALGMGLDSEPAPAQESSQESASMMNVSLEDLGVRSNAQAGLVMAGVVVLLMAAGGAFTYLGTGREPAAPETGHAEANAPFVIGAPIPEGLGAPLPASAPPPTSAELEPEARAASASTGRAPSTSRPSRPSRGSSGAPPSVDEPDALTPAPIEEAAPSETPRAPAPDSAIPEASEGTLEERDVELEMYAGRVRFLVQRYYSARAQTCFDHATINNPGLHGAVVIDMTIGSSGEVSAASVARNSTGDAELGGCLARQVGSWRVSPPPSGEPLQMQMPFSR